MSLDQHLQTAGILMIILAIVNLGLPSYFHWREELPRLGLFNRQMVVVHAFFIVVTIAFMGILALTSYRELQSTILGHRLAIGLAVFWGLRLLIQIFGYSPKLWIGKKFETTMHVAFLGLWSYLSGVFIATAMA